MKNGLITLAGTGIRIQKVIEIDFPVTVAEMEQLLNKLKALRCGDSTEIFKAEGEFDGTPVVFKMRLKQ